MDAIRAESLVKEFGSVRALDQASITIEKGELFFLLGASGCGKTTLLRCIAGLEIPNSGRVVYGDRDVTKLPTHKREAAMVFQSYALWPHMSVGENVAFGLEERKVPRKEINERVDEALAMVHLEGYNDRRIDHMSGGQQQRVAVARAIASEPELVLADEPTANLDSKSAAELMDLFVDLNVRRGITFVIATHDVRVMDRTRRLISMRDGCIISDEQRQPESTAR